eukprot:10169253-Prorocentrum_lima.AAC.1
MQTFAPALRLAVVAKHAPAAIKEVLRQNTRHIGDDYKLMKRTVLEYIDTGATWGADGVRQGRERPRDSDAMDIGAVWAKGKHQQGGGGSWKGQGSSSSG